MGERGEQEWKETKHVAQNVTLKTLNSFISSGGRSPNPTRCNLAEKATVACSASAATTLSRASSSKAMLRKSYSSANAFKSFSQILRLLFCSSSTYSLCEAWVVAIM